MKSLRLLALMALAAALHGQTAGEPVYWSNPAPDCSSLSNESPVPITNSLKVTIGFSCYVSGTFIWLAAGGGWGSSIRVAAPASADIGVDYTFYDTSGNNLNLDTTFGAGSSTASGSEVTFALFANQPAEVDLLGATSTAPKYNSTATGTVYAVFYCPDAATCSDVLPQLFYSALPAVPWFLSVPISWDTAVWTQWSAEGIDDGAANRVSLVIYNEDLIATSYTVRVYDSTGSLAGTGTTPSIPPLPKLSNGSLGEGGTYGALLSDVIKTRLPSGIFKVLIDGGSNDSAVEVLQFTGPAASSMQVAYDSAPSSVISSAPARRASIRAQRVASRPKQTFRALAK